MPEKNGSELEKGGFGLEEYLCRLIFLWPSAAKGLSRLRCFFCEVMMDILNQIKFSTRSHVAIIAASYEIRRSHD